MWTYYINIGSINFFLSVREVFTIMISPGMASFNQVKGKLTAIKIPELMYYLQQDVIS